MSAFRRHFAAFALLANVALFCSTAIQVGFAHNLQVPTVPPDITMGAGEAFALPGLAARDWAAGACLTFAIIGVLGLLNRIPRRAALLIVAAPEFLTLLPIVHAHSIGRMPPGADWIFLHHCISGGLALLAAFLLGRSSDPTAGGAT